MKFKRIAASILTAVTLALTCTSVSKAYKENIAAERMLMNMLEKNLNVEEDKKYLEKINTYLEKLICNADSLNNKQHSYELIEDFVNKNEKSFLLDMCARLQCEPDKLKEFLDGDKPLYQFFDFLKLVNYFVKWMNEQQILERMFLFHQSSPENAAFLNEITKKIRKTPFDSENNIDLMCVCLNCEPSELYELFNTRKESELCSNFLELYNVNDFNESPDLGPEQIDELIKPININFVDLFKN